MSRPATHAGAWYTNDGGRLRTQIAKYFSAAAKITSPVAGARILVGPHAGYAYSGPRLAETFAAWDTSKVRRVFVLGPSHHVYFRQKAMVSRYSSYDTPLGPLPVDTEVCAKLCAGGSAAPFGYMSSEVDDDEHSFEMHAPFIAYRAQEDGVDVKIVPIMVSGLSPALREKIVEALAPYMEKEENTFVVSSDFCHWGRRFGYTEYVPGEDLDECDEYSDKRARAPGANAIWQSIEFLDRSAMAVAQKGSADAWDEYIEATGNTICGQKPLGIVLRLLEKTGGGSSGSGGGFKWLGYSQSSQVLKSNDSSVSYASGYVAV
ncbi:hypothetical protein FT663_04017 [Candidozyma haemuli var. vulneris]|uniref:AmmeMemoRadiSam system protein B n=1 Tax=Candidozyma haemuli TaxID=45357 RepID=A0A2V1ARN0_9ASCO|nr:AmmeMemoRadiSam system protein B [[Candida] haemuloni]KAF3987252.1 hypothetical protein FT662_04101 [[Candida] haemuloni var. vulneris]KAF3988479.1 hypothetical protein FT663_04017 [[Candida] haemuloni var. vulneris]PVH20176.1 AmmeMemoRadiSam system protein B [[Candida] haemuloni]